MDLKIKHVLTTTWGKRFIVIEHHTEYTESNESRNGSFGRNGTDFGRFDLRPPDQCSI